MYISKTLPISEATRRKLTVIAALYGAGLVVVLVVGLVVPDFNLVKAVLYYLSSVITFLFGVAFGMLWRLWK